MLDFSPRGWGRVWLWTTLGTLFCVAVVLYVDSFNFPTMTGGERLRAIIVDLALPIILGGTMLFFLTSKLRQLAIAHHQLEVAASTDSLTGVLNRGAFTTLVDAYLTELKRSGRLSEGALLVVDADNFKSINDSFGHEHGDVALRDIAHTIRANVRAGDLVGRIGGEEFAILLPGTSAEQSVGIAERIRLAVADIAFEPVAGKRHALSVSMGGALFRHGFSFSELFRVADQQLYAAKQSGRNRLSVSPAEPLVAPLAA